MEDNFTSVDFLNIFFNLYGFELLIFVHLFMLNTYWLNTFCVLLLLFGILILVVFCYHGTPKNVDTILLFFRRNSSTSTSFAQPSGISLSPGNKLLF